MNNSNENAIASPNAGTNGLLNAIFGMRIVIVFINAGSALATLFIGTAVSVVNRSTTHQVAIGAVAIDTSLTPPSFT